MTGTPFADEPLFVYLHICIFANLYFCTFVFLHFCICVNGLGNKIPIKTDIGLAFANERYVEYQRTSVFVFVYQRICVLVYLYLCTSVFVHFV